MILSLLQIRCALTLVVGELSLTEPLRVGFVYSKGNESVENIVVGRKIGTKAGRETETAFGDASAEVTSLFNRNAKAKLRQALTCLFPLQCSESRQYCRSYEQRLPPLNCKSHSS